MTTTPPIFILAPNLFGFKGGVQVYSDTLIKALQHHQPDSDYRIFLKYENPEDLPATPSPDYRPQTQFTAFGERVCDTRNRRRRWNTARSALTILRASLHQRPQLIITTELNQSVVLCHWLKRSLGIPYWAILHGIEAWDIQHPSYRAALAAADRVIAVSHHTRHRVLAQGYLCPERVSVLPNAFDPSRFRLQPKPPALLQRHSLNPEQPVLLTVTRLQRCAQYKGYDAILEALPVLRQQISGLRYVLVGKGDDLPRIQAKVQSLGLQDCVILTGFIPDAELPDYYSLCDVFAMPSKGEGFGIVYLEALASGKPVLAGNQDGAVDPLNHGELGCLIDPDDPAALIQTLGQLLSGTHPNPKLKQPHYLRQVVSERYGHIQFQRRVGELLETDLRGFQTSEVLKTSEVFGFKPARDRRCSHNNG